ncbi:MAG: hypothetical protein FJ266_05840 [Planctomycetes bacterium]|nr:hypothetical protein [Planctomycetota bacterium]
MYCRYENRGHCELNKKECVPASKGCVIRTVSGITLADVKKQPPGEAKQPPTPHFKKKRR